ncbi:MAG: hypothetical protein JNL38_41250 [Myxococcales bacterium]|nr:hypothetical protein [Myxococcales bacterium]
MTDPRSLKVLLVSEDDALRDAVEVILAGEDYRVHHARTVEASVQHAREGGADAYMVDVTAEGGAALALFHHLGALSPSAALFALVPPDRMELGAEALSLGASSLIVSPPTGDALLLAVAGVRARIEDRAQSDALKLDLGRAQRRLDLTDRVVRLANGAGHSEAVRAISDALNEISGARGTAIYATFDSTDGGSVRLAALGTGKEYPHVCALEDLRSQVEARGASVVPLSSDGKPLGLAVLEDPTRGRTPDVDAMGEVAAAVLALVDFRQAQRRAALRHERSRAYSAEFLREMVPREIERSRRHGRRVSFVSWTVEARHRGRLEDVVLSSVRDTDWLCYVDETTVCLVLPDTNALGAHCCRRRVSRALRGDRRGAPASERGSEREISASAGVATFPHDGVALERLLRVAGRRAKEDARSLSRSIPPAASSLAEIVDAILARPIHDAGARSPYPLDVPLASLGDVVASACREAMRAGETYVHATVQNEPAAAVAARREAPAGAVRPTISVVDVREAAGCADVEVVVVSGETGSWACCGRIGKGRFRGVHAWDPLLADVLIDGLRAAGAAEAG